MLSSFTRSTSTALFLACRDQFAPSLLCAGPAWLPAYCNPSQTLCSTTQHDTPALPLNGQSRNTTRTVRQSKQPAMQHQLSLSQLFAVRCVCSSLSDVRHSIESLEAVCGVDLSYIAPQALLEGREKHVLYAMQIVTTRTHHTHTHQRASSQLRAHHSAACRSLLLSRDSSTRCLAQQLSASRHTARTSERAVDESSLT